MTREVVLVQASHTTVHVETHLPQISELTNPRGIIYHVVVVVFEVKFDQRAFCFVKLLGLQVDDAHSHAG